MMHDCEAQTVRRALNEPKQYTGHSTDTSTNVHCYTTATAVPYILTGQAGEHNAQNLLLTILHATGLCGTLTAVMAGVLQRSAALLLPDCSRNKHTTACCCPAIYTERHRAAAAKHQRYLLSRPQAHALACAVTYIQHATKSQACIMKPATAINSGRLSYKTRVWHAAVLLLLPETPSPLVC